MAKVKRTDSAELMIVNDSPGQECRIAILEDGHLEELYGERTATATGVGNIYKGRVAKVEPAIQAAFVDYGRGQSGFLHVTDLHPRYFPGGDRTERVGKRTPRRERPLIQEALRSGKEVLVQVLKEGIGTKGPTLTSYLSIPGRLMVMMPGMDRVGVSRKIEDEEKRREMRAILDQLDLPEGFGFILRTAGFDRNKTDLKRDVAYLTRLWKVMEKRINTVPAPCELYTESDLLIRTIRDVLRPSIKAIIVDSPSAYQRASTFLRVVAPRSAPQVLRYNRAAPIFHAFDVERQIDLIHSREVPLPAGGRLVIEQTEALVAIDVNSGRSRAARDSETNAYHTNCEAVDEIARQLRLRDLGGLVIHDLIDMRAHKHRKAIEDRFRELLKRDRARSTILPISEFGILEMTRQRMRPSLRKSHYMPCPHCDGRGEVKMPDSLGGDAVRQIGYLLQFDRVHRVELVCSPRVASVLLSSKRRELVRLEEATSKRIDVRVSDAIAIDRVDYYAYDDRGADIEISRLPALKPPTLEQLVQEETERVARAAEQAATGAGPAAAQAAGGPADAMDFMLEDELELAEEEELAQAPRDGPVEAEREGEAGGRRRRRRRRRRGRGGDGAPPGAVHTDPEEAAPPVVAPERDGETGPATPANGQPAAGEAGERRRRRRRRRRGRGGEQPASSDVQDAQQLNDVHGSVRIHELAKQIGVSSSEIIRRSHHDQQINPTTAMSSVAPEAAETIRQWFADIPLDVSSSGAEGDQRRRAARAEAAGVGDNGESGGESGGEPGSEQASRRRRRGGRGRGGRAAEPAPSLAQAAGAPAVEAAKIEGAQNGDSSDTPRKRRRRRGGRGRRRTDGRETAAGAQSSSPPKQRVESAATSDRPSGAAATTQSSRVAKPRRTLYRSRAKVSPTARSQAEQSADS